METKKLDFSETLKDAITIGVKNAPSIIAAVALWLITIWIPYLNIGTTIAITLLPTQLAKGEIINPLGIFDAKYRRYMGEFFITMGLMVFPILIGVIFMLAPAVVLAISWSLAYYFLIEKGKNPIQAIKASNDATYGSKWIMFFVIAGYRYRRPNRLLPLPGPLQRHQRQHHHHHRDVHPLRAGHLDQHGRQRILLETAQGQRRIIHTPRKLRTVSRVIGRPFFSLFQKNLSKNDKYYLFFEFSLSLFP